MKRKAKIEGKGEIRRGEKGEEGKLRGNEREKKDWPWKHGRKAIRENIGRVH